MKLEDSNFQLIEIRPDGVFQDIGRLYSLSLELVQKMGATEVRLNNDVFRISFADGRLWRLRFFGADIFSYGVNGTDKWSRTQLIDLVSPMNTLVLDMYGRGINYIKVVPV